MCGRYVLVMGEDGIDQLIREGDIPADTLVRLMGEGKARIVESSRPRRRAAFESYNIAPTHKVPIVVNRSGKRQLEIARWSFIPSYWKEDKPPKFSTFSARDDRLKSSGFWRGALDQHRCMVPASGFYEWKKVGKERLPYYIHRKDGEFMAFAGLYSERVAPETGDAQTSFTVITTPTNRFMKPLHDRIPLIFGSIEDELWSVWLDPQTRFDEVERHVTSREWPEMTMHRVSTDVNATSKSKYVNDGRLIEPGEAVEEQGELL